MDEILVRVVGDESAEFTYFTNEQCHSFSASVRDGTAYVEYEESLLKESGVIQVGDPPESIWRAVMQSGEMSKWLDSVDAESVRQE